MTGLLGLVIVIASMVLSVLVVKVFHDLEKPAGGRSMFLHSLEVSVVGFAIGYLANWMAKRDQHKMRVGRVDRAGRPRTNAGRYCGLIAMGVAVSNIAITVILWLLIDSAGTSGVASWMR